MSSPAQVGTVGTTLQTGPGAQPGQALLQAVQAVRSVFTGVCADVLDAGGVRAERFQKGSHRQTRAGLHAQVCEHPGVEVIVVRLLGCRLVELAEDVLALSIGSQVPAGRADVVCCQDLPGHAQGRVRRHTRYRQPG